MTVGTTLNANTVNATTQYNIGGSRAFSTTGSNNVFAGANTGTTGGSNSFFGSGAGDANSTGSGNTVIGANADVGSGSLNNATAIGANATVTQSNSLVLGGVTGQNSGTSVNVGIGTTAPKTRLEVAGGNIHVTDPGQGIILKSPDGSVCRLLSIDNAGAMVLASITCP
jgi:trimeric autotransporter adhesin